jgi:hypothetical protein
MKANPFDVILKARNTARSPYSKQAELQRRYYWLAVRLKGIDGLTSEDKKYLVGVFLALSRGANPTVIFGGKSVKGSRRGGAYLTQRMREAIKGYIAVLISPEAEGGFSMPPEDAIQQAAESFGYSPTTIKRYWHESDKGIDFIV